MMRSATAFLPDSITTFMNFERSTDPNLGSGRISRLGTSRRRGMVFPSSASVGARHRARPPGWPPCRMGPSTYSAERLYRSTANSLGNRSFELRLLHYLLLPAAAAGLQAKALTLRP